MVSEKIKHIYLVSAVTLKDDVKVTTKYCGDEFMFTQPLSRIIELLYANH